MLYKVINKKLCFANYKLFKIHNLNKMCISIYLIISEKLFNIVVNNFAQKLTLTQNKTLSTIPN